MKKIIITLAIIAAVLGVGPYIIGSQAEETIRDIYAKANKNPYVNYQITEYNRGWFTSDAKTTMTISGQAMQLPNDFNLIVTQKMQHGPVLWQADGLGLGLADSDYGMELPADLVSSLKKVEGLDENVLSMVSRMGFDGSSISIIKLNPFNIKKDNQLVAVRKGEFIAEVDMAGEIVMQGDWFGMSVKENEKDIVDIGKLSIDMQQSLIRGELFDINALFAGDFEMVLDAINVNGKTPAETMSLATIEIKADTKAHDELMDFNFFMGAKKIAAMGQEFTEIGQDFSLLNMDQDSMQILNNLAVQGQAADPTKMISDLQGLLPKLIDSGFMLKINRIGMQTAQGEINTSADIVINKDLYDANNPMSVLAALEANAQGFAPEAFFTQLGMQPNIDMLLQQNALVRDNGKLTFTAQFKGGQATLNGSAVPLAF